MNGLKLRINFLAKLTTLAAVLLFSQQSFAAGTTAGTDVDNLATVSYEVNTVLQTVIESAPGLGNSNPGAGNGTITSFEVDNRVDFTLVQVGGAHTVVAAGETDQFVEFLLTNVGNSVQDFRLFATQLDNPEAIFGRDDTDDDIGNLRVRVGVVGNPAGAPPTTASDDFVDELGEGESVIIYLYGDDLGGLVHDDVMNIDLTAVVAEGGTLDPGGSPGADLTDDAGNADDPTAIDIVFADGAVLGDGTETDRHGFVFESAGLNVSKVATVISDPFNGTTNPKAVPGAIVEYVITVTNSGTGVLDAGNVSISDDIDADVTFITGFYTGQDLLVNNVGSIEPCIADAADGNNDGCALDVLALTIGDSDLPITLDEDESLIVTYRVLIPL